MSSVVKSLFIAACSSASLLLLSPNSAHAQLTGTANADADALAALLIGSGFDLVPGSASLEGAFGSTGTFDDQTGDIFDEKTTGIILSSGSVDTASISGPNDSPGTTTGWGTPGFAELDSIVSPLTTQDGASLSFQIIPKPGVTGLQFKYVFGSEEYNEFVGSQFNDAFGLFVNGVDIALLPGTNTPVTINNVNLDSNSTFYRNNTGAGLDSLDTELDGLTTVLTAILTGLESGQPVNLRFSIADTADSSLDSAVFIKGESIEPPEPNSVPGPLPLLGIGAAFGFSRKLKTRIKSSKASAID